VLGRNWAVVKYLFSEDADIRIRDKNGKTPRDLAVEINAENEIITILTPYE
jgi:ankyrin repeat protein